MGGRLQDEVALITGSTRGLGREMARLFAQEGARVVVTGRSAERGEETVASIEGAGGAVVFVPADLGDEEQCEALVEAAVLRFGPLTVLVNNAVAGGRAAGDGPVADVSAWAFESVLRVNLVAVATMCRLAIPHMLDAGHGSIVNISSRAAELATPRLAAYAASKGGLNALTRSITIDYARQGIRCNTVQPGYILHEVRDAELTDERRQRLEEMHLTRLATATDVAYAAVFLASREAEVISGITLPVDGGSTAARARRMG
ncbi:MAG TPA: SDR family oxidoreductase [Acidimicrobiales bacterium]|nr:SDR family oxidoreductase [Acidimicrobiales bacterium]